MSEKSTVEKAKEDLHEGKFVVDTAPPHTD